METRSKIISEALSQLAVQGIAFLHKTEKSGEDVYVVDRVQLKESEIVTLYNHHALTRRGIQKFLLSRAAA